MKPSSKSEIGQNEMEGMETDSPLQQSRRLIQRPQYPNGQSRSRYFCSPGVIKEKRYRERLMYVASVEANGAHNGKKTNGYGGGVRTPRAPPIAVGFFSIGYNPMYILRKI
ncbi:hypothetical protein TNCV_4469851 [Trichonephila clavipes]|nr:hypothetical protein TNCV_4469851 [Trichonephila clavipes]